MEGTDEGNKNSKGFNGGGDYGDDVHRGGGGEEAQTECGEHGAIGECRTTSYN